MGYLSKVITFFDPRSVPTMPRPSYVRELVTASTMPVAWAMVEGGVIAVLAEKVFHVSTLSFATILAAPLFANLTSWFWAMASRGRPKIGFIVAMQTTALVCVAAIAFLPTNAVGEVLLVTLVVIVRCLIAGILTLRSVVWRMNYPRSLRAQITSKFVLVATPILAVSPLVGYAIQEMHADAFRLVYPAACGVAVIGLIAFSRLRLRGERELLRFERQPLARPQPHGAPAPIYEFDPTETPEQRMHFWTVLKRDHLFRSYMIWQFVGGIGNMIGEVAVIRLIIQLSEGQPYEYVSAILLTTTLPLLVSMMTTPLWARYQDRVHIVRFRTRHLPWAIATQISFFLAAQMHTLWLFLLPRLFQGIVRGGGVLAWQLGHHDFADRRMVAMYMGIHVTLTGVRGALGAYVAVVLLDGIQIGSLQLGGIGAFTFLVTAATVTVAQIGFSALNRSMPARPQGADRP